MISSARTRMPHTAPALFVCALSCALVSRPAAGQDTGDVSVVPIPARTWVRIQVSDGGTAWQVGEIGHQLPGGCTLVMVPVPGTDDQATAVLLPHITRLEIARGGLTSGASAAPDGRDDARWVPYVLTALRQHEVAAGCMKPDPGGTVVPGN